MTTLHELRDMLREAKGPSRELSHSVAVSLGMLQNDEYGDTFFTLPSGDTLRVFPHDASLSWVPADCVAITSSIDSALALVERLLPGWEWSVWRVGETCGATVYNTPEDEIEPSISSHASTAPLAILLALVEALIAKEESK